VETADGEVLWNAELRSVRVAPADEVYQLTQVLSSDEARSSMFGYNSPLDLGIPAAVKSGSSDETRDAWTIGFTPGLVAGVWAGNANNSPIPGGTSTYTAAPIWHAFMLEALQGQPVLAFLSPDEEKASEVAAEQRQPAAVPTIGTPEPSPTERRPPPTATPRANPARTPIPPPTPTARPSSSQGPPPTATPRNNGQGNGNGNGQGNGNGSGGGNSDDADD